MARLKSAWDKLSMSERALFIKLSVDNGVSSLKLIRDTYNLYSSGGDLTHKYDGELVGLSLELMSLAKPTAQLMTFSGFESPQAMSKIDLNVIQDYISRFTLEHSNVNLNDLLTSLSLVPLYEGSLGNGVVAAWMSGKLNQQGNFKHGVAFDEYQNKDKEINAGTSTLFVKAPKNALEHELLGHGVRDIVFGSTSGSTLREKEIIGNAYPFLYKKVYSHYKDNQALHLLAELLATNTQLRAMLQQNTGLYGEAFDKYVDSMSYEDLYNALYTLNSGYYSNSDLSKFFDYNVEYTENELNKINELQVLLLKIRDERNKLAYDIYEERQNENVRKILGDKYDSYFKDREKRKLNYDAQELEVQDLLYKLKETLGIKNYKNTNQIEAIKNALKTVAYNTTNPFEVSNNTYLAAFGGPLTHKKSGKEYGESSWLNNGYNSSEDWLLLMRMRTNQMLQNLLNSPFYMTDLEMLNLEVARIKEAMAQSPTSEMVSYPWVNEQGDEIIKTIPVGQRDKMELGLSDPLLLGLGLGKAITNGVLPVMYNQGVKLASKLTPYLDMASPGTASFMQNVWNAGKAGKALGIGLTGLESYNIADAILNYRYNPNAQTGVQAGLSLLPFVDGAQFIKLNIQNPFKIINTDDVYKAMADAMSPFTTSNIVWADRNFWSPKGTRSAQIPEYARLGLPKGSKVPYTEAENIAFRQQINDFAAKYGYEPIGDDVTDPEVLERYARSLVKRHNTFFRGVMPNPDFPDLSLEYMATHAFVPEDPMYISPFESVARGYGHPVEILRPYHLGEDRTKWFTEGEFPIYTSGGRGSLDDWKDKSAIAAPWMDSETLEELLRTGSRVSTPEGELTGRNLPFIPMRVRKGTRSASLDVLSSIDTSFEGSRAVPNTPFYTITDQLLEYLNKYGTHDTNSDAVSYAFEHGLLSPEAMVTYKQLLDGGVDVNLLRANQVEELAHLYTSKEGLPFTIDNFKLLHTGLGDFVVPPLVTMMPSTTPLSFENYTIPQRSSGVINPNSLLYTTNDGIYGQRLYNAFKQLAKTLDIPQAEFEQFATKPFIHAFKQYYYNKDHHVGDLTDTEIAKIIAYNYRLLTANLTGMLKDQILWNGSGRVIDNQGNIVRSESPDDFTIQMDWLQGGNSDKLGVWFGPYEEAASYGYPRNLDTREFFRGLSDAEHFDVQPYLISNVEGVLSNPTSSWLHFPNKHSQYGWNPMLPSNTVYTGSALVGELVTSDLRHIKGLFPHPQLILQGGSQRSWDVPGLHYSDGGNLAHKKSTGGPLYPFSFEKNPFLKTPIVRYDEGGDMSNNGGYTDEQLSKNQYVWNRFDPTGRFYIDNAILSAKYGNLARGEENEYWKAYLGLDNSVPMMRAGANTEWDQLIENEKILQNKPISDFYGTTTRMDHNIQALADTLFLGDMYRNYNVYSQEYKDLPSLESIGTLYEQAKTILNNPNQWVPIDGDDITLKYYNDFDETSELNPLGMLAHFGLKWVPELKLLFMHDTYDFPNWVTWLSSIPDRPKEMKIRSKINFDPNKGSWLLRNATNYNTETPAIKSVNK